MQTILWFLLALFILVTIHEFGHFYAARRCGVRVLRFSIGFGNPLFSWRDKKGTDFSLAPIPLGGYVKMLDEREGEVKKEDLPYAFTQKNVWQRIIIVAAGPAANFLLAIFLFWALLLQGKSDLVPVIDEVEAGSIAAMAGLERGQEIVSIDNVETPTTQAVLRQLIERLGESGTIAFSVKYPDSDYIYSSDTVLENWLKGAEEPDPIKGLGITFQEPPVVIGLVVPDGPGEKAGFQKGDRVVSADGQDLEGWEAWANYVSQRPEQELKVVVEREGRKTQLVVTPRSELNDAGETVGRVALGAQYDQSYIRRYEYSFTEAFVEAVRETGQTSMFVLTSVKKLIMGEISTKNLSGPITIAKVAGSSAASGWKSFVSFLALLSVSLGVFNLLPIPVLDGGHLLYYLVEVIKGSPVSEKIQVVGYQVGLFLVVGVMILALYNDVLRL
ncbi:MAG: RIP metalloprotease RseP [Cellvibrionaceae bacterium]